MVVDVLVLMAFLVKSETAMSFGMSVRPTEPGGEMPNSIMRSRETSSTSNSKTTSGSAKSCRAMIFSINLIASGLSRTISMFSFSSTTTSRDFRMVFRESATPLARAFVSMKDFTTVCWYSLTLAGLLG